MLEFTHVIELLGVLTTVLIAVVQYFEIENQKSIKLLKNELPPEKDLPRDDKASESQDKEIFNLRRDVDNLRSKDGFCKADDLIKYHLWLLVSYIIFTFLYIVETIFFKNVFSNSIFDFYLLLSSGVLVFLSYRSIDWLETAKKEKIIFSNDIKTVKKVHSMYKTMLQKQTQTSGVTAQPASKPK